MKSAHGFWSEPLGMGPPGSKHPVGPTTDGGSVWESNPPTRVLAGQAGFEDQSRHQSRSTPKRNDATSLDLPGQFPSILDPTEPS